LKIQLLTFLLLSFVGLAQEFDIDIKNLDINTEYPHFGIMPVSGNQVIFTSYKLKKNGKVKVAFSGEGVLSIYKGKIDSQGQIFGIEEIRIDPLSGLGSITSAAISADGGKIYIMTTYTSKNMPKGKFNKANFHLEVGEFKSGVGYTNFKVLPFCQPRFSYGHPALSSDGKALYFTANIKGGRQSTKGGSDIFRVDILDDSIFSEPLNLGYRVNSYSREMFPIITDNALYFSSDRRNGFGGYDIYKSAIDSIGAFLKAEKLLRPLNSVQDDFSYLLFEDGKSGLLVSKRSGGKGDDDIYYFSPK